MCVGWIVQYVDVEATKFIYNQGLIGGTDITPTTFTITSNGSTLSAIWVGNNGVMEIKKIYHFDTKDLYFKTSVSMKNISPRTLSNLFCKLYIS